MNGSPLIHTINGNVPVESLSYETKWEISDKMIHFTEIYRDALGVIVRQDAHVCALRGPELFSESSLEH
jgi:hypothetical protein